MNRFLWMASAVAPGCIAEHGPTREGEDVADASPDVEPADRSVEAPRGDAAPPGEPIDFSPPDQEVAEPAPPAVQCPPDGRRTIFVGAAIRPPEGLPPLGTFTIESVEEVAGQDGALGAQIGRLGDGPFMGLTGRDADGRIWTAFLSLPARVALAPGMRAVVNFEHTDGFIEAFSGDVRIEDEGRLQAWVVAGSARFGAAEHPDLRLERGDQSCYHEDDEEYFCTYTGFNLRATTAGDDRQVGFGERAAVGPFAVIHAGLMSIGDRGACNAAPEEYAVGAARQ